MKLLILLVVAGVLFIVGRVIYRRLSKPWYLRRLVGKRLRISYYDHNEHFEKLLPRTGTVRSRHASRNTNDWFLVELDEPFTYEGRQHRHVLIRSKWAGRLIGRDRQTAVFLLLIPEMALLEQKPFDVERLNLVAWGYADVISKQPTRANGVAG